MMRVIYGIILAHIVFPSFSQHGKIHVKPWMHEFKKIDNLTILRIISNDSAIIKVDTFRKQNSYWVYSDAKRKKAEYGEYFTRYIVWDLLFGVKIKNISYVKNGNWYYINYNTIPPKFKKRKYTRFRRFVMSDLYFF